MVQIAKQLIKPVLLVLSFFVMGQRTSSKKVYSKDTTPALIEEFKDQKGFVLNVFNRNSNFTLPDYNGVKNLGIESDLIIENRAYPDYVMELELIGKKPKVYVFDTTDPTTKQKVKSIYIISQFEAIQYLTEKEKGFFFERSIKLKRSDKNLKHSGIDDVTSYDYSMQLRGKDYSNSVLAFKNVSPSSVRNYVERKGEQWVAKTEYVDKVNKIQAHKLYANCVNYLNKLFNSSKETISHSVTFIKKWKEQPALMQQYNSIVDDFVSNVENEKYKAVSDQARRFRALLPKLDTNERRQKKLYSATLQSITLAHFLAGEYENVNKLVAEKRAFDENEWALSFYVKELKKIKENKKVDVTYKSVPSQLSYTQDILDKKTDRIENVENTSYENKRISDFITINTLHEVTKPKYSNTLKGKYDQGVKSFLYVKLPALSNSNYYYKQDNPEFYKVLKTIKKRKKELKKEHSDYTKLLNAFVAEYDYAKIHALVKKPSLTKINKSNKFNEVEKTVFASLTETYSNLYLIHLYGDKIKIENYERIINQFIQSLEKHIASQNIIMEEPAEILLGLKRIKTQSEALNLNVKERLNLMFRLSGYASRMSL